MKRYACIKVACSVIGLLGTGTVFELLAQTDGKTITENRFGRGRVFWGKPMAEVLAAIGVTCGWQKLRTFDSC